MFERGNKINNNKNNKNCNYDNIILKNTKIFSYTAILMKQVIKRQTTNRHDVILSPNLNETQMQ